MSKPFIAPQAHNGRDAMNAAAAAFAAALCDSSSHMNLLPHAEQRPCDYHRQRAKDAMKLLAQKHDDGSYYALIHWSEGE